MNHVIVCNSCVRIFISVNTVLKQLEQICSNTLIFVFPDVAGQRQPEGGLGKRQQPRGFKNPSRRQQHISQPVLNMLNMWAGLGEQPAP